MIDPTYRGHDDRHPQQDSFREKSAEHMAAFYAYVDAETPSEKKIALNVLMSFSKTQIVHCPRCGARMTDGKCWQGCNNEAALASQREVDAAIIAAYAPKPTPVCPRCGGAHFDGACRLDDDEPAACGNYIEDEVADMRHPTW